jgi:hypothetical protein
MGQELITPQHRVFITDSADDGITWAEPVEITTSVKRPH